jgi:hypothetical protein
MEKRKKGARFKKSLDVVEEREFVREFWGVEHKTTVRAAVFYVW